MEFSRTDPTEGIADTLCRPTGSMMIGCVVDSVAGTGAWSAGNSVVSELHWSRYTKPGAGNLASKAPWIVRNPFRTCRARIHRRTRKIIKASSVDFIVINKFIRW